MQYENNHVYDLIGIGIGPMNLGLAALATEHPQLNCLFLDCKPGFDWHPGLMIKGARMQVPWLADLVTFANPCSKFIYTKFLKSKRRLVRFAVTEQQNILRKEFQRYCRWTAEQLSSLQFNHYCEAVTYSESLDVYIVHCLDNQNGTAKQFHAKRLVIGTGTVPSLPKNINTTSGIFHSSGYLKKKPKVIESKNVAVIGSGQSAAEIYYDLLTGEHAFESLRWFTRTDHFPQMDVSSFVAEMSTPDYIRHFYKLSSKKKKATLEKQQHFFKGINADLLFTIYNELNEQSADGHPIPAQLFLYHDLKGIASDKGKHLLTFNRTDTEDEATFKADTVILATGYQDAEHSFLSPIRDHIRLNTDMSYAVNQNYSIDGNDRIFVQNHDLHTHGFNSADLGMAPYRNAVILNTVLGKEYYELEYDSTFQQFNVLISKNL